MTAGRSDDPHDGVDWRRRKLVWEAALGFVGFFTFAAALEAVANALQPEPRVLPALVLASLLLAFGLLIHKYRRTFVRR